MFTRYTICSTVLGYFSRSITSYPSTYRYFGGSPPPPLLYSYYLHVPYHMYPRSSTFDLPYYYYFHYYYYYHYYNQSHHHRSHGRTSLSSRRQAPTQTRQPPREQTISRRRERDTRVRKNHPRLPSSQLPEFPLSPLGHTRKERRRRRRHDAHHFCPRRRDVPAHGRLPPHTRATLCPPRSSTCSRASWRSIYF